MGSRSTLVDQTSRPRRFAALCAAIAACVALPAMAGDPSAAKDQAAPDATSSAAAGASNAGMMVAIDPATGRIRPVTAEEAKTLNAMTQARAKAGAKTKASSGGASRTKSAQTNGATAAGSGVMFKTASGAKGVRLDDSQMVYTVVTRSDDGTLSMDCVKGSDAAAKAVETQPQTANVIRGTRDETK
jgi:hypothetical protein